MLSLQPYQLYHITCSDCLDFQLDVMLVVFLSKLKTEVVKYTACLHILGKQTVLTCDVKIIHKDGENNNDTTILKHECYLLVQFSESLKGQVI